VYYYVKDSDGIQMSQTKPVWKTKYDHGPHWLFGRVQFEGGNQSVTNFIVEGYAHGNSYGIRSIKNNRINKLDSKNILLNFI
jgi:hypothetical protein